jgi:hypothetical protein
VSRRTRTLRYGASIAVALVGVACGALIPGSAGGTAATVLVGIGLVGVVSLMFYEVGLTEDRERAARAPRDGAQQGELRPRRDGAQQGEPRPPRDLGSSGEHQGGRSRRLERRRGQRRRLD